MIKLFADTASNLTVALNKKYNVNIIPLSYTMDGKDVPYDLEKDFDGKAFYDAMRNGAEMKTSMANSSAFYEAFEETVKNGDDIIYIGLSGGVSGT
ncbi:MAG: DegV family protein, partial [Oscillospiraceae bacterium]|nr:DegV family protein [Oscillospiraceae bacterium]